MAPPAAPSSCLSRGRHAPRPAHAHLPGRRTRTPTGHHFAAATPGARVRLPATSDLSEHQAASAPRSRSPCAPTTAPRGLPAPTLRCAPSTVTEHRAPRLGGPWGHAREGAGPARVLSPQPQDGAGATGSRGKRPLRSCLGRTPGSRAEALRARSRDPSPLPPAGEGLPGGARLSARASLGSNPGHPLSEEKDPETAPRSPHGVPAAHLSATLLQAESRPRESQQPHWSLCRVTESGLQPRAGLTANRLFPPTQARGNRGPRSPHLCTLAPPPHCHRAPGCMSVT